MAEKPVREETVLVLLFGHVINSQSQICRFRCRDLTEEELGQKGIQITGEILQLNQELVDRSGIEFRQFSEIPEKYLEIHRHLASNMNTTCSSIHQQIASGHRNIHTCPSLRMENYDKNRIPKSVHERQCLCSRCQGLRTTGTGCGPVLRSRKVLRRIECRKGVYRYAIVMEAFSHGCECQMNSVFNLRMEE